MLPCRGALTHSIRWRVCGLSALLTFRCIALSCFLQGIKRECKSLPLSVRQMVVQQVQLEAIKRREAVGPALHMSCLLTTYMAAAVWQCLKLVQCYSRCKLPLRIIVSAMLS